MNPCLRDQAKGTICKSRGLAGTHILPTVDDSSARLVA